jgi:truncated hemoglobin YjbI
MQNAGMMIPFLNAQIQGLDVLYRASGLTPFSKNFRMPFDERVRIREKFYKRAAMLFGSTAIYTVLMMDDDRYKRAKPEERYGNWFIVNPLDPEGDLIRVPIPFEVGILFKAIPEALINVAFGDETAENALKGMGKVLEQSNPFSFPTFIKPATEVFLNRSFFGGDIESTRELKYEKSERVRPGTTGTAALLGQAGILSPIQIDHLIRGYTGSAGIFLADTVGLLFPTKYDNVERPTKELHEMPLIGSMFQNARGRGIVDAAYDRMAEVQRVSETYKLMISEGRKDEAKAYLADHLDEAKQIRVSGQVEKYLGELAKQKRQVMSSPKLTTEQKDKLLEKLDDAQNKIAKRLATAS